MASVAGDKESARQFHHTTPTKRLEMHEIIRALAIVKEGKASLDRLDHQRVLHRRYGRCR